MYVFNLIIDQVPVLPERLVLLTLDSGVEK